MFQRDAQIEEHFGLAGRQIAGPCVPGDRQFMLSSREQGLSQVVLPSRIVRRGPCRGLEVCDGLSAAPGLRQSETEMGRCLGIAWG